MMLTAHAYERAKQRLGLSKKAAERLAARAWERGVRVGDVGGNARAHLELLAAGHRGNTQVVYGEVVYSFGVVAGHPVLVTTYQLPLELREAFLKARRRKG